MKQANSTHEVWSTEQDGVLLETVLQHLGKGSSQKKAFEEAARKIGRTAGACAFRFNAVLRKRHNDEILSASAKDRKGMPDNTLVQFRMNDERMPITSGYNWQDVLVFLNSQVLEIQNMQQQLYEKQEENIRLHKELDHLKQIRNKMDTLGLNISKMLDLINEE